MADRSDDQFNIGQRVPRILVRRQLASGSSPPNSPGSPKLKVNYDGKTFNLPKDGIIHVSKGGMITSGGSKITPVTQQRSVITAMDDGTTHIHFDRTAQGNSSCQAGNVRHQIPVQHKGREISNTVVVDQMSSSQKVGGVTPTSENVLTKPGHRDSGYSTAFADFEKMFDKFREEAKHDYVAESSPVNSPNLKQKKFVEMQSGDCGYTCHHKCQKSVTLDCSGGAASGQPETEETALHDPPNVGEQITSSQNDTCETDSGYSGSGGKGERTLTREDLQRSIWQFNKTFPHLVMTMPDETNTFLGFIHVNMNLSRPINMRVSPRPPSIYEVLKHEVDDNEDFKTKILSFYLPRDTVKALHIKSSTTAQEVIETLLNKFKITDNPRKFALYEQTLENNSEIRLRKILDSEHPLILCLQWGDDITGKKRFVMQENETGEIMWEAFSIPELQNFLKILDLEKMEAMKEIKNKYVVQKRHMQELLGNFKVAKSKERT